MRSCKTLILGASGCGTTTLAAGLSKVRDSFHADSDHYFWIPTNPPFTKGRPYLEIVSMLQKDIEANQAVVMSGSFCGWGDLIIPYLDRVFFVTASTAVRLERIRQREEARLGKELLYDGGSVSKTFSAFVEWSKCYDTGGVSRTRQLHEDWMSGLKCPVIRIDGELPQDQLLKQALTHMG